IIAGKSGIRKIDSVDVSDLPSQIGGTPIIGDGPGECNFDLVADAKEQKRNDRVALYALVAADEAIRDANLTPDLDYDRIGTSIGSGIGGLQTIYDSCIDLHTSGPRTVSPFFIPKGIGNMPAGQVSIKYGLKGPNISIVTACATGTHSIGEGARLIQHGDADVMVCGGCEAAISRIGIAGFCAMKALSHSFNDDAARASRPWDKERDGFVIAEGAGILVLEEYEHAKARGAKIYAEVAGYGMSGDAHHITAPAPGGEGGYRAMAAALKDAGLAPADVDYINAHGTSTGLGDIGELTAVQTLFGQVQEQGTGTRVSMSSTKSMTGHLLGAAGAVEAIFCACAIRDGIVPPTINLENPEDLVGDFDLVPGAAKKREVNVAVNNSFGFGGTNASVVLKKIA
ncbi:MAG: beta-ketoacyl-ACP synthase II, partial [Rickettsiales bacterium]|nr:beta-ketoacyl-ACP synthase II [Rickettsiales bacterium]